MVCWQAFWPLRQASLSLSSPPMPSTSNETHDGWMRISNCQQEILCRNFQERQPTANKTWKSHTVAPSDSNKDGQLRCNKQQQTLQHRWTRTTVPNMNKWSASLHWRIFLCPPLSHSVTCLPRCPFSVFLCQQAFLLAMHLWRVRALGNSLRMCAHQPLLWTHRQFGATVRASIQRFLENLVHHWFGKDFMFCRPLLCLFLAKKEWKGRGRKKRARDTETETERESERWIDTQIDRYRLIDRQIAIDR